MSTVVCSAICDAMNTTVLQIESSFTRGFAGLHVIGNTAEVCRDGKERARAALETLGIFVPARRTLISLTPADVKKDGNHLDLPVAVTLSLLLVDRTAKIDPSKWLFAAELGLSGELKPVHSVISFAISAVAAGLEGIVVAEQNLKELSVLAKLQIQDFQKMKIYGFSHLSHVIDWLFSGNDLKARTVEARPMLSLISEKISPNFDDMLLTAEQQKVAAACGTGLHSIFLRGCPGSGKSMFAARLPSILPKMARDEHIECLRIQSSFSQKIHPKQLIGAPPFRSPHHQTSPSAVLGNDEQPGELSLSHGGVLFLDEFSEFRRDILEALREPLETGEVRVSRAKRKVIWKARLILVAAANNCACGWFSSKRRRCDCSTKELATYRNRISGPILDRIDIHINFPEPKSDPSKIFVHLAKISNQSSTATIASMVQQGREFAKKRNSRFKIQFNRDLEAKNVLEASGLKEDQFSKLVQKTLPGAITNRSILRTIRVARTLADIDRSEAIREQDLSLAWSWQAASAAEARGEELPYACKTI